MAEDLTTAKNLISEALSTDEQAEWHERQRKAKALDLLGHVTNVEAEGPWAETATADERPSQTSSSRQSTAAVAVLSQAVSDHSSKLTELKK